MKRVVAFLFPGQGAEQPGMGLDFLAASQQGSALVQQVGEQTGTRAADLLLRGGSALSRTDVLQPLLTAVCLLSWQALCAADVRPQIVAGHSLGEVPALCAAGCLSSAQTVELAALRGRAMAQAAAQHPGSMLALSGMNARQVLAAIHRARRVGPVDVAAENAPQQWVLSGDRPALLQLLRDARSASWLPVSGPWHSRAMQAAKPALIAQLRRLDPRPPLVSFVAGCSGRVVTDVAQALAAQIDRPVCFARVLRTLVGLGVTDVVTVGPGKILRGLVRANLGSQVRIHASDTPADVARCAAALFAADQGPA